MVTGLDGQSTNHVFISGLSFQVNVNNDAYNLCTLHCKTHLSKVTTAEPLISAAVAAAAYTCPQQPSFTVPVPTIIGVARAGWLGAYDPQGVGNIGTTVLAVQQGRTNIYT